MPSIHPRNSSGEYYVPSRVPPSTTQSPQRAFEAEAARYEATIAKNEEIRAREEAMANPVPITESDTSPTLKSPLLKDEAKLNLLAKGTGTLLKEGMTNVEVLKTKEALEKVGIDLGDTKRNSSGNLTGLFDSGLKKAVEAFQEKYTPTHTTHANYSLDGVDGVVGRNTILALDEAVKEEWLYEFKFTVAMLETVYDEAGNDKNDVMKGIVDELNERIDFYQLNTLLQRTHFFAQVKMETGPSLSLAEFTNYRISAVDVPSQATARKRKYPLDDPNHPGERYIDVHAAATLTNRIFIKKDGTPTTQEDKRILFNVMYGGREELENGDFLTTDDGWTFRGRGLKQLTGRYNYRIFNEWHEANQSHWPDDIIDAVNNPEVLLEVKYAVRSAASFWVNGHLGNIANNGSTADDVDSVTNVVNEYTTTKSRDARKANFKKYWEGEIFR